MHAANGMHIFSKGKGLLMIKTKASTAAKGIAKDMHLHNKNADWDSKSAEGISPNILSVGVELECGIMGPDIFRLGKAFERLQFFKDDTVSSFEALREFEIEGERKRSLFIGNAEVAYWSSSLQDMNKFFRSAFSCIMSTNRTCSLHVHIKPVHEIKDKFVEVFGASEAQAMLIKNYTIDFKNNQKYIARLENNNCMPVFLESNVVKQLSYARQSMKALPSNQSRSEDILKNLAEAYRNKQSITSEGITLIRCMRDIAENLFSFYSKDPKKQVHTENLKEIADHIKYGNINEKLDSVTELKKILRNIEKLDNNSKNIDVYCNSLLNIQGARKTVINLNPINDIGTIEFRLMPYMESADEASNALTWVIENIEKVYNKVKDKTDGLELDFRNFMSFELDMVKSRMPNIKLINRKAHQPTSLLEYLQSRKHAA